MEGLGFMPTGVLLPVAHNDNENTSSSSDSKEDNPSPWTLVQCRHAHSLDSVEVNNQNNYSKRKIIPRELMTQQNKTFLSDVIGDFLAGTPPTAIVFTYHHLVQLQSTIEAAKAALTAEQKDIFHK